MNNQLHFDLSAAARRTMLAHGFEPDFPPAVAQQLQQLHEHPLPANPSTRDLRGLLWSSIDNDTSKDLDQIEYVEGVPGGGQRVLIGVADVDAFVPKGSPIDQHALRETTTVYTGVDIFPMLPVELSTGLTSLLPDQERAAVVVEFTVDAQAQIANPSISLARVTNKAQLAYPSVGAWLSGKGDAPPKVAASKDLQQQLHWQDDIAQRLRTERYRHGALNLETIETQPIRLSDGTIDIEAEVKNRATQLIEDFMIAANGVIARALDAKRLTRRCAAWCSTPKRWDRIVESPPAMARPAARRSRPPPLHDFLCGAAEKRSRSLPRPVARRRQAARPGEYVLEKPGEEPHGHFGLAVQDYTHSTAPNRRYADLIIAAPAQGDDCRQTIAVFRR